MQIVFSFVYILKGDISYQAFGTEALVLKWFGRPQTCCAQEARVQSRPASLHKAYIFCFLSSFFCLFLFFATRRRSPFVVYAIAWQGLEVGVRGKGEGDG